MSDLLTVVCPNCGKKREITKQQMTRSKYTGLCTDCNRKSHKGSSNPNWKNGRRLSGGGGKYIYQYAPIHPDADSKGYVALPRLVAEKMLGRRLLNSEVIHHLDGNVQNNEGANIIILANQSSHAKLHKCLEKVRAEERAKTKKGLLESLLSDIAVELDADQSLEEFYNNIHHKYHKWQALKKEVEDER